MRSSHLLILGIVALLAGGIAFAAELPPGSTQASTSSSQIPVNLPPSLAAIRDAADPSTAVNAYAKAVAGGEDQIGAERVYLVRMTDFGLPEMADAQAQDLILRDPSNGLAWGVAAHMSARRGNMAAALGQVETATNFAPGDPFVLRTAGNIFAWYNARGAGVDIPDVIKTPVPQIKQRLMPNPAFADAYNKAADEYAHPQQQPQQPAATTQAPPQTAPAVVETYTAPSYPVYDTAAYYPSYYSGGYYSGYASPCWYPSSCNAWPWWGGFGASFVFVSGSNNNCNNNNWHGHGGGHDGNWHGDGHGNWNGNGNSHGDGGNNWHGGNGNGNWHNGNNAQGQTVNVNNSTNVGAAAGSSGARSGRGGQVQDSGSLRAAGRSSVPAPVPPPNLSSGQNRSASPARSAPAGGSTRGGSSGARFSTESVRSGGGSPGPVAAPRASSGGSRSGAGSSMSGSRGGGGGGGSRGGGGGGGGGGRGR